MPSVDDLPPPPSSGSRGIDDLPPPSTPGLFDGAVKNTIDALPMIGGTIGGVLGTPADVIAGPMGNVAGAAAGGYLGTATKNLINKYYDPDSAPKNMTDAITQPIVGGATQAAYQATGEAAAPYIARGVKAVTGPFSDALSSFAANKAVAATGATGKQAAKFADDAGQQLIDRGIVKFGDSQASIAQKASDALAESGDKIGKTLTELDKRGATVDQADIIANLRKRAAALGKDPSQYNVSDSLTKLADRIQSTVEASGGNTGIPLSEAEATKRGFQSGANYNSSPHDLSISKEAAGVYQRAVEDAATKFDPQAAGVFTKAKADYRLLSPIEEAAQKRAITVAQSPHGGLLDTAAGGVGAALGGAPGAMVAPIARRALSTRAASSMAGAANAGAKMVGAAPGAAEGAVPAAMQGASPAIPAAIDSGAKLIPFPAAAGTQQQSPNRSPAKGEDLWAQQGMAKLGIQDDGRLMNDPKAKQLLIQASDLAPGSKAMKQIQDQLRNWGNR